MKSESVSGAMVLVLFVSALFAVWVSVRWFFSVREMQELQTEQNRINNTRMAAQSLANDAIQYGRQNPRIEPLLGEFNLRPTTNEPSAKPATK
ncbi:MAG TPA: hypothetical protein VJ063_20655 [Verrucomicrobiae bacterium]|nr:hypothetical protein [Verrucomicrobiae bacterium]